jgi:hypothetical protein
MAKKTPCSSKNATSFAKEGEEGRRSRGRPKGAVNKSTQHAREAIARFVDGNADRLNGWLEEIYDRDGPKAAFQCVSDLLEYHVPKLSRTEMTGKDEGPVELVIKWADE